MVANRKKLIWIDMDNSPHVVFFRPIIEELRNRGYQVEITVRDCFQVCGLADLYSLQYKRIGKHYGKNKILKAIGLIVRSLKMIPFIIKVKPSLALSHGARSQMLAAKIMDINSIHIFDYEFAKNSFLIRPKWGITPEIVAKKITNTNLLKGLKAYPGIKEDVYVPNFKPDASIHSKLCIRNSEIMVTIRPPATEAHYHNPQSETLFKEIINMLNRNTSVRMVILPRNDRQKEYIKEQWPQLLDKRKIIIPGDVVDGLSLIWFSDFVISGGGTMNREAAALGVPVYSIFRGKIGAIDHYLADQGRLTLLKSVDEIKKIVISKRKKPAEPKSSSPETLNSIIDSIMEIAGEI